MDLLPRIEIDGASKTIGNSVVLDQIQLTVKPGEMIGLQGVNGSGKTMLLRLISGLIYPTKGHVLIDGKMLGSDLEFPPSIGFLIENPTFLPQYTGAENLQMLSSLHQMMPTAQIESVLQRVGLHDTKYKKYSLGMKQRLGIAAAVFEQPDIILLDEPTNALDESGITMLENVIQDETSRGATIVMASHDMNFLHHCCSKIYTLRAGPRLYPANPVCHREGPGPYPRTGSLCGQNCAGNRAGGTKAFRNQNQPGCVRRV